jgi:hypothetical protein
MIVYASTLQRESFKIACRDAALHWAVLVCAGVIVLATGIYGPYIQTSFAVRSIAANLLTQVDAVVYLTTHLVRIDALNADPLVAPKYALSTLTAAQGAVLAALLISGLVNVRRAPSFAFAVLWFFVWLSPTNSFIPRLDVVNDRQLYAAMVGPAWFCACAAERFMVHSPRFAVLTCAAVLAALAVSTAARNAVYFSETAFWRDVVAKSPHNARAWNNLGFTYSQICDTTNADDAFHRALLADPRYFRAAVNLDLLKSGLLRCRRPS